MLFNIYSNPVTALGAIFLREFIDSTFAEKWQKHFEQPAFQKRLN